MAFVAAAICPHPPLLVPAAMGAAGWPETEPPEQAAQSKQIRQLRPSALADTQFRRLRAACYAAVRELDSAAPDLIAVVGSGPVTRSYPGTAAGTLRGLGIPFTTGDGEPVLPLSLTIGSWLIRRCLHGDGAGPSSAPAPAKPLGQAWQLDLRAVAGTAPPQACLDLGRELAVSAPRVALLVVGDGTARKALGATGAADPAADRFDASVADALATADVRALASLDPQAAAELLVSGRVGWQVLAGAAGGVGAMGAVVRAQLRFAAEPIAISYFVASWTASR